MIQELQVGQMNRALRTVSLGYAHPYIPVCTSLKGKMHTPDRKGVHRYDSSNEGLLHCINDMTATEETLA